MISKNAEETKAIAREFVAGMGPSLAGATVVELVGELGAGKTTFMSGVGNYLGVKETIISPTFLIQRNYDIAPGLPWKRLIHIDAYRIEKVSELEGIDWQKYSSDPDNIIFIEWPANMMTDLHPAKRIEFKHINETEREIIL